MSEFSGRYIVQAKRKGTGEPWSEWAQANSYKRATEHARYVTDVLGQMSKIVANERKVAKDFKTEKKCFSEDSDGRRTEYPSMSVAARLVKGFQSGISLCCRGKKKTYKGYKWGYV